MPVFVYEGKSISGSVTKGKMEAINKEMAKLSLREKGIFTEVLREETSASNVSLNFSLKRGIPYQVLAIFCRQMYFSLSAGIPMLRSVAMVKDQAENKKLKKILESVFEEIQKGQTLSEAFKSHKDIPYMLTAMLEVGESTGNLDSIMGEMADYYDKQHRQRKKIDSALTYPKFLLGFSLIIVMGLVTFVVPTFVEGILSAGQELPITTEILINISAFVKQNFLLLTLIVVAIIMFKKLYIDKNEKIQFEIDKFLVTSKYLASISQQIFTARFARTFGLLIEGGMNVMDSLTIAGNAVDNRYIKKCIDECRGMINSGEGIAIALESKEIFPIMLTQMMKVGEETGSIDDILRKTSEYYDIEAEFALQKLTSLIEPIMIVFLSIIVGFVVISMALPMFQMMGAV